MHIWVYLCAEQAIGNRKRNQIAWIFNKDPSFSHITHEDILDGYCLYELLIIKNASYIFMEV